LPYMKPKPKKPRSSNDVYYDIEAMIAQQLELLHNRQTGGIVVQEQEDEPEDIPAPKRKKLHPSAWKNTFGLSSSDAATTCRRYQFEVLRQWDVKALGETVEGFDQTVIVDPNEVLARLAELKPAVVSIDNE